jgi:hypothetical protein
MNRSVATLIAGWQVGTVDDQNGAINVQAVCPAQILQVCPEDLERLVPEL